MTETETGNISSSGDPLILALDTASKLTSIAVARGATILANFSASLDETRSTKLWGVIDFLLNAIGQKIESFDLFAACTGPGGFTGLRVGIATAKAFAAATAKHTVGVTSLEALAGAAEPGQQVCSLINAYKGEVYSQLFSVDMRQIPVAENQPIVGALEKALERVASLDKLVLIGDAATQNAELISQFEVAKESPINQKLSPGFGWRVQKHSGYLAEQVAIQAFHKYLAGWSDKPEDLQATYVRGADIKIKLQA
jgi:tRNA threonylcarbamoyladenosine biosynthesis protein TsaB